jgi:hypothetical protein
MRSVIDFINSLSTFVVAVFTVVMCVLVAKQNRATKVMERAWVIVEMDRPPAYEADKVIRYEAIIRNTAHTPARITALGSHGQVVQSEKELPSAPKYDMASPFPATGNPLPPGAEVRQPFWLDAVRLAKVEKGEAILFLFGIIQYDDVFGDKHETRYCFQFKPALGLTDPVMRDFYVGGPATYLSAT